MAEADQTPHEPGAHGPPPDLDYAIIRSIGRGGYGEVWLVRDKEGEYRACKVVYRESFQHARPYEREYEGIRKFEPVSRASESQVKILYVGQREAAGYFFYIMELADDASGAPSFQPETYTPKTLRSELERRGRLPLRECIQIGLSLTAALENLHQHGLIHRDVKPANIIFVKGVPKLADIGLVTDADVTVSYVGTSGFIPPEGPSSPQADVYALGKVLYEMSTGQDRLEYPELPADFGEWPDHDALLEFNAVVAKACEADARRRYPSAAAMRTDLELVQSGKSIRQIGRVRKRRRLAALAGCVLLAGLGIVYLTRSSPPGNPPSLQGPLPDAARVAHSEASLRETYRAQLAVGTRAAQQQAAFELIERSSRIDDGAAQLAALRLAALLATKAGNFTLAMQACDQMAERFPVNSLPAKAEFLEQAGNDEQIAAKKPELAGLCVKTAFEALGADDYGIGMKLDESAKAAAKNAADPRLIQEAAFLDREMTKCRDAFEQVKPMEDVLKGDPQNPEANLAVGRFLCFVKNDWEAGLPLLARATNQALQSVVAAEMDQKPKTTESKAGLAEAWGRLAAAAAGDQADYYGRARYWSLKAIVAAKEPEKSSLREQLSRWLQSAPTEPGEIHIYSRVAGTETIDVYGDELLWRSGRGALSSRVNEVSLGDLKAGDLKVVKNCGATRILPESVAFSTARLTVNRKPKGQGKAKLEARTDHVRVTLSHPRPGYAEVDVTVSFGVQP